MSNILFIVMYGIAETAMGLCAAATVIYLGIFGICLVNSKLYEFKKDKNVRNLLKCAMLSSYVCVLSSYVCVLSTIFCAIIAGFKGV